MTVNIPIIVECECTDPPQPLYHEDWKPIAQKLGIVICRKCGRDPWDIISDERAE